MTEETVVVHNKDRETKISFPTTTIRIRTETVTTGMNTAINSIKTILAVKVVVKAVTVVEATIK